MGNIGNLEKSNLMLEVHFRPFFPSFLESVRNERNGKIGKNLTIGKEFRTLKTMRSRPFFKIFPDFSAVRPKETFLFGESFVPSSLLMAAQKCVWLKLIKVF